MFDAAHAVHSEESGPRVPSSIDTQAARLLALDPLRRIEVLQLAGEMDRVFRVVEVCDLGCARFAREQVAPRGLGVVAERRHGADARDHHPPSAVHAPVHHIPSPPSTSSTSPVMNEASSEHRNRTARATSSAVPKRPRGVFASIASLRSSAITWVSRVSTYPGATTFARTPRLPSSRASAFVKPMIPAFEAE